MSTEKPKQQAAKAGASPAVSATASSAAKKPAGTQKKSSKRVANRPAAKSATKKTSQRKPVAEKGAAGAKQPKAASSAKPEQKPRATSKPVAESLPTATISSEPERRDNSTWFAVAAALVALVLAGYAAYQGTVSRQISDISIKGLDERVSLLVTDQQGLKREFSDLLQQRATADAQRDASLSELQKQLGAQQTELEKVQLASQATTDDIKADLGSAVARWKLDEMQSILLRVNQYYQFGGDKSRTIEGLELVRSMLAGIDDPRLAPVGDGVAQDLLRINSDALPDMAGINSRLMALSALIPELTLAGERAKPAPIAADAGSDDGAEDSLLAASRSLLEDIGSMVKYTNREAPLRPSLDSNERFILYELLQLKLQVAMAALIRGDSEVYQAQLKSASEAVNAYFEPDDSVTGSVQRELESLLSEKVSLEIEPLSAALSALNRVMIVEK